MSARKPAAQHRAPAQHGPLGCSQDRLDRSAAPSDCPTPPGAVPAAEDAVMLIARHVAHELGAALVAELRAIAEVDVPALPVLLSVPDVARMLQVEARTIRRWRTDRLMPDAITVGGVVRWRREAIESWLEEREGAR